MKILALVTDAFGGHGGIAKFNRDLLTALCHAPDVEKVVALPRLFAGPSGELPARLQFDTSGVGGKIRYAFAVLRSSIHHPRSSIIICGHINLLPLAFLARKLLRIPTSGHRPPILLVIHGIDAWKPTGNWVTNWLVHQVDAVLAVSEFTRQKFWDWAQPSRARSFILPNCIDLTQFTPGPKKLALLDRYELRHGIVILTVARLSALERYKGIDQVLEVMPLLAKEIPNLAYLIVGDGTDRARLMEKARALGLRVSSFSASDGEKVAQPDEVCPGEVSNSTSNLQPPSSASGYPRVIFAAEAIPSPPRTGRGQGEVSNPPSILHPPSSVSANPAPQVIFTGHIPESEKVEHYRLADAFVMPGWGEGFGIVYLEAMACGVPVVASKLDASQEAVQGGKLGNLVNPRVPGEIVHGTLAALRSPKGVPAGLDHFSQAHFQRRVHAVVRELAAQ